MKKGFGSCPATCGELVQGLMGKGEYISSYCIDMFSKAVVTETSNSQIENKLGRKSLMAIKLILKEFDIDEDDLEKIDVKIDTQIPRGKGMASSTADIGSCIMAILDFYGLTMPADKISKLVSSIEPTDSIYHRQVCIFNPLHGEKHTELGYMPVDRVLVLEPNLKINTVSIRANNQYYNKLNKNKVFTERAFKLLEKGIKTKSLELIRAACENSALANESIKNTPALHSLIDIAEKNDYGFLNIAHTGTVVGIGIGQKTDLEKLVYEIRNSDISKIYKKQYIKNIISGGLRKGL